MKIIHSITLINYFHEKQKITFILIGIYEKEYEPHIYPLEI